MRGGSSAGVSAGAWYYPYFWQHFAFGFGGEVEGRASWFNLTSVDYDFGTVLTSATGAFIPSFSLSGLFGEAKRLGLRVNVGPGLRITGLPDGTRVSTVGGLLPAEFTATFQFRL